MAEGKRNSMTSKEKKTVLIIDDEMEMRFYLMTMVKSLGHRPVMAKNGAKGLETLGETVPDLIILDIMMPEKGGALVYQEIKSEPGLKDIPLLIFSGVAPQAFTHYVKMLNANPGTRIPLPKYYVEKSADPDYLKKMITDCINDPCINNCDP